MIRRAPAAALFPYTTLFRSRACRRLRALRGGEAFQPRSRGSLEGQRRRPQPVTPPRVSHPAPWNGDPGVVRSEEHTSELQSLTNLVCRLLLEKNKDGVGA